MSAAGVSVLYSSGEESAAQIALRAKRIALAAPQLEVLAEIQLEKLLTAIDAARPQVVVVDS
jgi:DNA repair protein RadA/Sms